MQWLRSSDGVAGLTDMREAVAFMESLQFLFYIFFNKEYKIIALVALGCFLVAAVAAAIGKIGTNALIPVSQDFVEAGAPESSYFQTLGDFLYHGVDRRGYDIQLLLIPLNSAVNAKL